MKKLNSQKRVLQRTLRAFAHHHERKISALSNQLLGNSVRLEEIEAGKSDLTTEKFNGAMKWVFDNWRTDVPKPEDLIRWKAEEDVEDSRDFFESLETGEVAADG